MSLNVVFMGSAEFSVPFMDKLTQDVNLVGVITQPDRPAGRGRKSKFSPVKNAALSLGKEVFQPEKLSDQNSFLKIKKWNPDVIVVVAYGQILKEEMLNIPKYGCINVHASLLPRWRGASPIQTAILEGDDITGVSIMKMDKGMDTGPVFVNKSVKILADDTSQSLGNTLSAIGADLLAETLPKIISGKISALAQKEGQATYCRLIRKDQGVLDFSKSAAVLQRQIRAFYPWPGSFVVLQENKLKIIKAHSEKSDETVAGKRMVAHGYPAISTAEDLLVFDVLQPAGKRQMTGKEFLQGCRYW